VHSAEFDQSVVSRAVAAVGWIEYVMLWHNHRSSSSARSLRRWFGLLPSK
jgi:hypothetical protein